MLGSHWIRLTPSALERQLCGYFPGIAKKTVRSTIKKLVSDGILQYTNHFNTTHLELNYLRPVQVSPRIILAPCSSSCSSNDKDLLYIKLNQGGAFGIGDHPTTRLSLHGVDFAMQHAVSKKRPEKIRALDIGTGSGVLAIAAVGLGAESAVGLDICPIALHEAKENIRMNNMELKIRLTTDSLQSLGGLRFALISANLRPPTLMQMLPMIKALSGPETYWVFSGCKAEAAERLAGSLIRQNAKILWQETSCGWAGMAAIIR